MVDTSAIVSIFAGEPDAAQLNRRLAEDDHPCMSAATLLETSIVLRTLTPASRLIADDWLEAFIASARIDVRAVELDQIAIARSAHLAFGKGMGHPAQLNFGDCFAYALAKTLAASLLFKGENFARTDIKSAL